MIKESVRPNISEYEFLRLYAFTIITQGQSPIIKNHDLEKNLFDFYERKEYHFLFEDIIKKEDKVLPENNHIDLNVAFQTAYTFGLMTMIQDSSDLRSIVNYSQNQAEQMLSQFPEEQTIAMGNLCAEISELKNSKENNVLVKAKKLK